MTMTGRQLLFETLRLNGVTHVFGNPGTSELWFMEELAEHPDIHYILGLMEAAVVTMADAYAHASGRPSVVNLHIAPGLGNAIGSLYNALEKQTPMVVTAGQTDSRMRLRNPMTSGDLVAMADPVTKWSVQAERIEELPLLLDRAIRIASAAPCGPVFVSLPIDIMDSAGDISPVAPSLVYQKGAPEPAAIAAAADTLASSERTVIVAGDRAGLSVGAMESLVAIAEQLGVDVWLETLPAHVSFPVRHPLFRGRLPQDLAQIREAIGEVDAVLLVGGEFFEEVWYTDVEPWPEGAKIIHIDPAPEKVGENHRVDCGIVADVGLALDTIAKRLSTASSGPVISNAGNALAAAKDWRRAEDDVFAALVNEDLERGHLSPSVMIAEIARAAPSNVAVTAEIFGNTNLLFRCFDFKQIGDFLSARGGGIGQAIPSGIGMALADPDRPVLALTGDGSAMYTIPALWTAAKLGLPIVVVVLNNGAYGVLKDGLDYYRARRDLPVPETYPHLDLVSPPVDFVSLARGLGVAGHSVHDPADVAPSIEKAFALRQPYLIDVHLAAAG